MPDNDGFLRIIGPAPFLPSRTRGAKDKANIYLDHLVKMIPGEVLAFYPAEKLLNLGDPWPDIRVWPILCLLVLIIFRAKAMAKGGTWKPQVLPFLVSVVAFIFWVYFTGDHFLNLKADGAAKVFLSYAALL